MQADALLVPLCEHGELLAEMWAQSLERKGMLGQSDVPRHALFYSRPFRDPWLMLRAQREIDALPPSLARHPV